MNVYTDIIRFNFLRFLAYPIELWAAVLKRVLTVGFLLLFWSIIANSSDGAIELRPLVSYFLISSAIDDVIGVQGLRFGKYLGGSIKDGSINNYLIRPLKVIPYLYSADTGSRSLSLILSVFTFGLGIAMNPPATALSVAIFGAFMLLATLISLAFNIMIGTVYFHSPEATNFRLSFSHVLKVFSGALIPLHFFPEGLRQFVMLSPFPSMIYVPAVSLSQSGPGNLMAQSFFVGLFWAIALLAIAAAWWKKSIRSYDAVGI